MSVARARRAKEPRPAGKDAVVRALLDAAAELFAERGPAAVSAREVARRARVNHGLVHRHFGSKQALVRAVLDDRVAGIRQAFAGFTLAGADRLELWEAVASDERYWKVLLRALLDGQADALLEGGFPLVEGAVARARSAQAEGRLPRDEDPRQLVASYLALMLGWLAFEPFIRAATGLGRSSPSALRRRMFALWERLERRVVAPKT